MSLSIDLLNLGIALTAFVLALFFVPLAQWFGMRFGFVDPVNPAKIHQEPKVRCGGLGIFLAFMSTLLLGLIIALSGVAAPYLPAGVTAHLPNIPSMALQMGGILAGASLLFFTGLADDRFNLRPLPKLVLQILSAVPLVLTGTVIKSFLPGLLPGIILTICWVVLLTNSMNFLDNMNGLSSGIAIVCAFNFYLISRGSGEYFTMAMFALLMGSALGFLRYNFPTARLFMGDSGSLFLGFMLAALSIRVTYYKTGVPTHLPVIAPLIVLGVPIFDTISVMLIRWRSGKPLMQGDQNHFSHRLVALGFTRTRTVLFIWMVTLTVGLTAVNLRHLDFRGALLALGQVVLFFLIIYFLENAGKQGGHGRKD